MSPTGQNRVASPPVVVDMPAAPPTTTEMGEVEVEEYGYGLGPPTGMLVFRYPAGRAITEFAESRDDFVHQLFWSPDGMLWVRRGATVAFVGPDRAVWVRRGVTAEVSAVARQTVLRVCLRQAPDLIARRPAALVDVTTRAANALLDVARRGVDEAAGLAARAVLVEDMADGPVTDLEHVDLADGPARSVARALLQNPADDTNLADWAARVNVSAKTLQRDFTRCFGEPFSAWRTRTRLEASKAMLSRWSVTETAHRVGYASVSAYVAAFTRAYGETPGRRAQRRVEATAS